MGLAEKMADSESYTLEVIFPIILATIVQYCKFSAPKKFLPAKILSEIYTSVFC